MRTSIHPLMLCLRLFRPDGNPLRRRSDRLESAFVLAALLLVLTSLLPAVLAGRALYENALRDQYAGPGVRRQVMATLLEDVPPARVSFSEIASAKPQTMARWTTPEGATRSGRVPAPALTKAGTMVRVWIDAAGAPASPPAGTDVLAGRGVAMGIFIVLVTTLLTLAAFWIYRRWVDHIRFEQWEADWVRADERGRHPRQP
ncbi:hypothetical protein [Nonomuraea basaltis]|uniref:Rv1733c family protein n=1 Tax=Nonomuraea basaltis TaxID=2495887 RepID=UPI00110C5B4D|nr:hypothetical protein [Nonomuraea basaltis]TMS00287.1 hypothetical protein EJK15_02550 [Nonomuraea basaltis]